MELLPAGTIYKNSAKPITNFKYDHPFDGHGFINAIKVGPRGFEYKGIRVKTMHYNLEKAMDTKLFRGLGTNVGYNPLFINNFSNISVFQFRDELFSMSEGGIPYKIDPVDGETTATCPLLQCLPYVPLTPHPKIETVNGKDVMYNASGYNVGFTLFTNDGIVLNELFPGNKMYYFHDFYVTSKYYVFYLNEISFNLLGMYTNETTIVDSIRFQGSNKILLVDRKTMERHYVDAPNMSCLHVAKCDDTPNGVVMYAALIEDLCLNVEHAYDFERCNLHKVTVCKNTNRSSCDKVVYIDAEMPKTRGDDIYLMNKNALVKYNVSTNETIVVGFDERIIEEPIVDERTGTVFVIGHAPDTTTVTAFDDSMEKITEHVFEFETSYGLHGIFVPDNSPRVA